MKVVKLLLISIFMLGSLSATAGCYKVYKDIFKSGAINSAAGMLILHLGIYMSYQTHQIRKMMELIKEAKSSRIGKRTKGLFKSLNGIYSTKKIHKLVLGNNKLGKFCRRSYNPESTTGYEVILYRDWKDSLRIEIDQGRVQKGVNPIWNDKEDLVGR